MIQYYLCGIFIITLIVLSIYLVRQQYHDEELKRISIIENNMKKKKDELEEKRSKTMPCNRKNLIDPRSCYLKSDYSCSWNEETERCDQL